jgi:AraC-like DNA-binding protein
MRPEQPGRSGPVGPLATLRNFIPFEPCAASDRLGWVGLEAARYRDAPAAELNPPALTHHRLVLFARPPEALDLLYEGVQAVTVLSLAEVALRAGLSDQSQFSRHFKRLVGVTPGRFDTPARIACQSSISAKKVSSDPRTIPHEHGWLA